MRCLYFYGLFYDAARKPYNAVWNDKLVNELERI